MLSLYWHIFIKMQIDLQGFSQVLSKFIHVLGDEVQGPGPVHGPWAHEKLTLGAAQIRQSCSIARIIPT